MSIIIHSCGFEMDFMQKWISGILLIILLCLQYTIFIKADSHILVECIEEPVSPWHSWWYDWWNNLWDYTLHDGIKCQIQCPEECYCGLSNFTQVEIHCTNGSSLLAYVTYPSNITLLSWAYNKLQGIDQNSLSGLAHSLQILHLNNNNLHYLQPFVFSMLGQLLGLDLSHNMLKHLKGSHIFSGLSNMIALDMNSSSLYRIPPCAFCELENLITLNLNNNSLTEIRQEELDMMEQLQDLYIEYNKLQKIQLGRLGNLEYLFLYHNHLKTILNGTFGELRQLKYLVLENNLLEEIQVGAFDGLGNLTILYLHHNHLKELLPGSLQGLESLQALHLSNNLLTHLYSDTFKYITNLDHLRLDNNKLHFLPPDIFQNLSILSYLNLSYNNLQQFGKGIIVPSLLTIDLEGNTLSWITKDDFALLTTNSTVFVDSAATCCFVTQAECIAHSTKSPFLTCKRLLGFDVLRVGIWIVSLLAISSNIISIFTRFKHRCQSNKVQFMLITNLAISDFFMGIYLLILISVDLYYKDYFPSHSEVWRNSSLCKVAGALSVLSSEASVFFITMISFDRAFAINFPLRARRLGPSYVNILVCMLWSVALIISVTSFVLSGINPAIYAVSEICIGLPISREQFFQSSKTDIRISRIYYSWTTRYKYKAIGSQITMFFSIAVFICLNLICFTIVGVCYTSIFLMARKSTRRSGRCTNFKKDIKMAKKMFLLVLTDFCCWVPIAVLSILVQAGLVTVDPVVYAWIATFILPINSSLNPFLYTIGDFMANKVSCSCRNQRSDETIEMSYQR